mgnify:CR=1 FL=1
MSNKLTKKDYFKMLLEVVEGNVDLENFIQHELDLLEKKATTKVQTQTQKDNETYKDEIMDILEVEDKAMTIKDIQAKSNTMADFSTSKMSALLKQLVDGDLVVRTKEGKNTYFSIKAE